MGVSSRHILSQGPVLGALGRTVLGAVQQRFRSPVAPQLPGPELVEQVPAPPRALIDDYVRYVGGDPRAYRDELPAHLFPQWCFPLLARTLEHVPYPLLRVVNGGCDVRVNAPLRADEPLTVTAQLLEINEDGKRAVLKQRVQTGTPSAPAALEVDVYAIVPIASNGHEPEAPPRSAGAIPLPEAKSGNGHEGRKQHARAPEDAHELARLSLRRDAGLSFAKLTGDFNPIHWIAPLAKASGFRSTILHGFAELAFAWEGLNRNLLGGDVHALRGIEIKLRRPLVLPHEVGLYVRGRELFLADAPGGPAYLTGVFSTTAPALRGGASSHLRGDA